MKYLEELNSGDGILLNSEYYVISSDFKNDGSRMCISLKTGFCRYIKADTIVSHVPLYALDSDSNIIPIKRVEKEKHE